MTMRVPNELFAHDRPKLMERLGRLAGSTTYRDQQSGGGTPFSSRRMTEEARMLVGLKLSQRSPNDVGPWLIYSFALLIDDRAKEIATWLAVKLTEGTGAAGRRNAHRMLPVAMAAYQLAVHGMEPGPVARDDRDFRILVNIGAGWLWTKMEATLDRVEYVLNGEDSNPIAA